MLRKIFEWRYIYTSVRSELGRDRFVFFVSVKNKDIRYTYTIYYLSKLYACSCTNLTRKNRAPSFFFSFIISAYTRSLSSTKEQKWGQSLPCFLGCHIAQFSFFNVNLWGGAECSKKEREKAVKASVQLAQFVGGELGHNFTTERAPKEINSLSADWDICDKLNLLKWYMQILVQ